RARGGTRGAAATGDGGGRGPGGPGGVPPSPGAPRRALGPGGGQGTSRYVRALDASTATVTVSEAAGLRARGLVARDVSWTGGPAPAPDTPLAVRIRHRHPPVPARLARADGAAATVLFEGDGPAVTPGQAAVFYRGDTVLGGGWIAGDVA